MKEMKCPACGAAVQAALDVCPVCGLEGLQIPVAYEIWKQETLEPHKKALLPRVFAGNRYGLILTHDGRLYGIGRNDSGQIDEQGDDRYSQPRLMAENVISAAAGNHYSVYVTRDGEVHLRGRGELADRFPGFSGAREVWALSEYGSRVQLADAFWICSRAGAVFFFGDNFGIEEYREVRWKDLGERICHIHSGPFMTPYTYGYQRCYDEHDIYRKVSAMKNQILREDCREALETFGGANVEVRLTETGSEQVNCEPVCAPWDSSSFPQHLRYSRQELEKHMGGKPYYLVERAERCRFRAEVLVNNRVLYTPVKCPGWQWMAKTNCRMGSLPVAVSGEEDSVLAIEKHSGILEKFLQAANARLPEDWQKEDRLALNRRGWLWLRPDGTVEMPFGRRPGGVTEPVTDLSLSENCALLVCSSGEILWDWWHDSDYVFHDLQVGTMNRCRLPE